MNILLVVFISMMMKCIIVVMADENYVTNENSMIIIKDNNNDDYDYQGADLYHTNSIEKIIKANNNNIRSKRNQKNHHNNSSSINYSSSITKEQKTRTRTTNIIKTKKTNGFVPDTIAVHNNVPHNELKKKNTYLRHVFKDDNRQEFNDFSYPWSTVGLIMPSGCTGTMVGPKHVLTAAHCLLDTNNKKELTFTPAYYDGYAPYGVATIRRELHYNIVSRESSSLTNDQVAFDYAVLILDHNIGLKTGWVGTRDYHTDWNNQKIWTNVGYPAGNNMNRPVYTNRGAITSMEVLYQKNKKLIGKILGHFIDIEPGHSGGPIWGYWRHASGGAIIPSIIGVQSTESFNPIYNDVQGDNQAVGGKSMLDLVQYALIRY